MSKPVRMCIVCRERFLQNSLIRLQCNQRKLRKYNNIGRSFYICQKCVDNKKLFKMLAHICKADAVELRKKFKEILFDA